MYEKKKGLYVRARACEGGRGFARLWSVIKLWGGYMVGVVVVEMLPLHKPCPLKALIAQSSLALSHPALKIEHSCNLSFHIDL